MFTAREINNIPFLNFPFDGSRSVKHNPTYATFKFAKSVLFLLYTGFRISEMLSVESDNVDMEAGANKGCIDLMMGHKSKEVGERIYTHKTIQELKDAIELIKNTPTLELSSGWGIKKLIVS